MIVFNLLLHVSSIPLPKLNLKSEECISIFSYDNQRRPYTNKAGTFELNGCYFQRASLSAHQWSGGVIYFDTNSETKMYITECTFVNCGVNGNGGAIYANIPSDGESYLNKVCAYGCWCTSSYGNFAYILVHSDKSHPNEAKLLTITKCAPNITSNYPLYLANGEISFLESNSSSNSNSYGSGIGIDSPSAFESSYCTYHNNKVSNGVTFAYDGQTVVENPTIKKINFVSNNSPNYGIVRITNRAKLLITDCSFYLNSGRLFHCDGTSLTVKDSYINHDPSLRQAGAVTIQQNNEETFGGKGETYSLKHYDTYKCYAENPYHGFWVILGNIILITLLLGLIGGAIFIYFFKPDLIPSFLRPKYKNNSSLSEPILHDDSGHVESFKYHNKIPEKKK